MIVAGSILVSLVKLIDCVALPPEPAKRKRGRQPTYTYRLILKALVVMIIRRLYTAWSLLAFLQQPDSVAVELRQLLTEGGKFPSRRTWERRLEKLPDTWPSLIGCFGRHPVELLRPFADGSHAAALDSTMVRSQKILLVRKTCCVIRDA